ncbi:uncharacterized protein LOC127590337 [Hippocampus zosterae]|uniref:uncharacterized protein LOC127590337 n=1 Tax=Hippocampus zosterae TaxID=109293 RepID=UPI00223DCE59|nr:uncharacterized protein LOC127590337 [Hippocampus zosterae]XP_051905805.1 uncharacterized protein LOC127590337 [Hippocampus zosterae]XP_051905806.1 uncharacterized protein LOC127590337 [Hippocampus zosterae]
MGRLDDAAKRKVVELRKAGLSFRKIKAVLELENIKVSAQAIYLFLREFQGRRPGRVRPSEAGSNMAAAAPAHVQNLVGGLQESWGGIRLQHLLREAPRHAGFGKLAKRPPAAADGKVTASGCGESSAESQTERRRRQGADDNDVQIVSVTSLALSQQRAAMSATCSPGTASVACARRRVTPSPATSSMLAARKRILDKALTHKMKVTSLLRREHANVQRTDLAAMSPQPVAAAAAAHYDLTTGKSGAEADGPNASGPFVPQRAGPSARSLHTPPRAGFRLTDPTAASSAPGGAVPRPPPSAGEPGQDGGLQEQIQTLGCEVRSLGLAVKMLAEQQSRSEREQARQTRIQKQILSTLQSLASAAGPGGNAGQAENKSPSPSRPPPASSSFGQDAFDFTFSQAAYESLASLDPVEAFKLPALSPDAMNGLPPCSGAENRPLAHTPPPQTQQPYVGAYPRQNCQTLLPPYARSFAPAYDRSRPQAFGEAGSEPSDFQTGCPGGTLEDCGVPTRDQHLNIIKVEGP